MTQSHVLVGAGAPDSAAPRVRPVSPTAIGEVLKKGLEDFAAMPSHALVLCAVYPFIGLVLGGLMFGYTLMPLVFPLAAGFALIGPFAALGLYELSRRREAGLPVTATDAFAVLRSPSIDAIVALGLVFAILFLVWVATAQAIYVASFGYAAPESLSQFLHDVFDTRAGLTLLLAGNGVGLLFAVVALVIGAVSFPLLLDREVGAAVAVLTSVRVVLANPVTMALWGLTVTVMLVIGSLPLFLGLPVVVPVLGHATWHLYRRTVDASASPRADFRSPRPGQRHAAEFPVSLFMRSRE